MKKSVLASLFAAALLFTGCAKLQDVGAYTEGAEVTTTKMDQIVEGKSKMADVEKIVGYPLNKKETKNGEIWYYPFTKIRHLGSNVSETTIFEFNKKGTVVKKYKAAGSGSNPLLR